MSGSGEGIYEESKERGAIHLARFPRVHAANLEHREFTLPDDFDGERNLVLIAFKREQQAEIDTWIPAAQRLAREHPDVRYYELPTISRGVPLARWWLDAAMRAGIPDRAAREATITLYVDKPAFRDALQLPTEETIAVLLVRRDGQVLWRDEGAYTEEKGQRLMDTLNRPA
ncbi:MAG TPA: hypothetical protein VFU88_07515 [Ktedonobacterales bacterium]|nr:hypothetical protein [Ktedonobacterales bacterium]